MSLKFITKFQRIIYDALSANQEIRLNVERICSNIFQDGKYPIILINISKIDNCGMSIQAAFKVNFFINIFYRQRNLNVISQLIDEVTQSLSLENFSFEQFVITSSKLQDVIWQQADDLITKKITMNFASLVKNTE